MVQHVRVEDEAAAGGAAACRHRKVLPDGGVPLSEEEWEVAHTYMAVAFKRVAREFEPE